MLVLCKPILELLTEHHAPCSGHSEQDCLAGFQDVDFGTLKGLWEGLNSSLFFLSLGVTGNQPNQLHLNSVGPGSSQSPMGMNLPGQQPLSHEPPPTSMMSSLELSSQQTSSLSLHFYIHTQFEHQHPETCFPL